MYMYIGFVSLHTVSTVNTYLALNVHTATPVTLSGSYMFPNGEKYGEYCSTPELHVYLPSSTVTYFLL